MSRNAVVTGAGSGIGRAVALALAADGWRIVALDQAEGAVAETGRLAAAESGDVVSCLADVSDPDAVARAFEASDEMLQDLNALVNVAGVGSTTSVPETTSADWDRVMSVNCAGVFLCSREALRRMRTRRSGSIVNIASVAGMVGLRSRAAYCASKGAVLALTRAMAVDHISDGIRVNAVSPGTVDSPWVRRLVEDAGESLETLKARQPMGRLGTPDEIAGAVQYLLSDAAAFVTGSNLVIDGGLTAA